MARIPPAQYEQTDPVARAEWDRQIAAHGRMTNMKRTLAHNGPALRALMEWYPLRDAVETFLGARLAILFAHAISSQTDCLICSTFFRRILIDGGENPDSLAMDERESTVVEFGRQLARDPHGVTDAMHADLRRWMTDAQIVTLTAFGAIMVATNMINNALKVDLDEVLYAYRKPEPPSA